MVTSRIVGVSATASSIAAATAAANSSRLLSAREWNRERTGRDKVVVVEFETDVRIDTVADHKRFTVETSRPPPTGITSVERACSVAA